MSDELCNATIAQWEASGRNVSHAGIANGIARGTFQSRLRESLARAAGAEPSTDTAEGPAREGLDPYVIKGVSTLRNRNGEIVAEWTKTKLDDQRRAELIRASFEAMAVDLPRLEPVAPPTECLADLLNLYTFTDYHLGALCWHKEGGADWDLAIAEATLTGSFSAMLEQSPRAGKAIINIQGDMLHTDGLVPVTPAHHHVLDADSRFQKVAAIAVRAIRRLVTMALERHDEVHLIVCEGNHDESSSIWLRIMFGALYENEPRVQVNDSELPFYVHQHGKVMLAFHHGHKVKNEALPMLFAAQFPRIWGDTLKRYAHTGHRHHVDEKEYSGMLVTQHPTLAARDAYAARGGWISERAAQSITYHAQYGQVARAIVCPEMLAA